MLRQAERSETGESGDTRPPSRWRGDLVAYGLFLAAAVWVMGHLWLDPGGRLLRDNWSDQQLFEWMLAHTAHAVTHGQNPFFTHGLELPHGANLLANTAVPLLGLVVTPVTLTLGPAVSFTLVGTLNLAATAGGWYYILSRHLVSSRLAAFVGAAFAAFAPGMISQANAHLQMTAQFLVPFIAWQLVRLREPGRAVRGGVTLGVLLVVQYLVGQEVLMLAVLGCGIFAVLYALLDRAAVRGQAARVLRGLGIAAGVALVGLAWPVWFQLFGPRSYRGLPWDWARYSADGWSYLTFAGRSLLGVEAEAAGLSANPTEQNTFWGLPLIVVAAGIAAWLWRERLVRALAAGTVVLGVLSLGPSLVVNGHDTGIPLPGRALSLVPVLDMTLPSRLALVALPMLGALLALGVRRAVDAGLPRPLWVAALLAALLPVAPMPLPAIGRSPVPAFFTSGAWRQCGSSVFPVPIGYAPDPRGMSWSTATGTELAVPYGAVLTPGPAGRGVWWQPMRPTAALLARVAANGQVPVITATDRDHARADLAYWGTRCVVLDPAVGHATALRTTLDELYGTGRTVDGVWLWRTGTVR
jgi:hypothetical protein